MNILSTNVEKFLRYRERKKRKKSIASCEDWTHDPWFTRPVLYHWAKEAFLLSLLLESVVTIQVYIFIKITNT